MKRLSRPALSVLTGLALAATVLSTAGCGAFDAEVDKAVREVEESASAAAAREEKRANGPFEVTYEVTADQPLESVDYEEGASAMKALESPKAPWRKTVTLKNREAPAVSAMGAKGKGQVTCRILYKGAVVKQQTAKGEYVSAICVALAPKL
ncbi:MmpS family transport accessory protein [Streptomyces sp. I05A-00742]|uniref:MmpS family transport accessory protein n=1 Tax=Streptomyces sp. I05A-00742 TaxID=2732853 RepID=UPI001487B539|nr:MmpS family transport accessory protein [Streptomyces sp. I05A-00742]